MLMKLDQFRAIHDFIYKSQNTYFTVVVSSDGIY